VPNAYPTLLQTMLDDRFVGEGITVINEGAPGEVTSSTTPGACTGVTRLPVVLAADQPNALMILEGINDIDSETGALDVTALVRDLGTMISEARSALPAPKYIFLSTLLPIVPPKDDTDCNGGGNEPPCRNQGMNSTIQTANGQIAQLAQSLGVALVDPYTAFVNQDPTFETLIGPDGLHPTPLGNQVLAQAFYNQIVANVPVTSRFGRR
jgi:lysophospholipase L1-like esterase